MPGGFAHLMARAEVWGIGLGIAGFLALTWMLRGSPFGQAPRFEGEAEETSRGYRDRVVVAAALGVLSVVAGAWLALRVSIPWSIAPFAGGFLLLLAVVRGNSRYRHESPTLHRTVNFADSALNGSLLAGALIVGNVLAFDYGERPLDFTREGVFTLETLTVKQLKNLKQPLHFTVIFGSSENSRSRLDRVIQLLDLYRDQNPRRITYEVLNPFVDIAKFEELAALVPDVALADGGVVVRLGKGAAATRLVVRNNELFGANYANDAADRFASEFRGEGVLSSAIMRLSEGKRPRIGFLTGHGEPAIDEVDPTKRGLGFLKARLEAMGSEAVPLNLGREDVPDGLAVLMIVGPRTPIEPGEADRLDDYVKRGGHLILMIGGTSAPEWNPWLKRFNLQLRPELVVDPNSNVLGRPWLPRVFVSGKGLHPIVETLRNESLVVPEAAPIVIVKDVPTMQASPFLRAGPDAWGETEWNGQRPEKDRDRDLISPLTLAAAVQETAKPPGKTSPRLVLFGTASLAENRWANRGANLDVVTNAIAWLRERNDLQGIAPRTHVALRLKPDRMLQTRLVLIPTLIAVSVIIGLGLATYLARRS